MKLHAYARLSVKGRELLVNRVENAGVGQPGGPPIAGGVTPNVIR
jgi:hypothetical protein